MLQPLRRLGVSAKVRLIIILAAIANVLIVLAAAYTLFNYESHRQNLSSTEIPLLSQVSGSNNALTTLQQDLLHLIDKARNHQIDEEAVYREGKEILNRVDELEKMISGDFLVSAEKADIPFEQFQRHINQFRSHLASAVEMLTVNLDLAEKFAHKTAIDALHINQSSAQLTQHIYRHVDESAGNLKNSLLRLALPLGLLIVISTSGVFVFLRYLAADVKVAENQLEQLAYFDRLTGLPNRRLLLDRVSHAIARINRHGGNGALLFLDLDRFKHTNDTLGHHIGDLLLQEVAQRLKDCVRATDTVGRLAGDEFLVLIEDLSNDSEHAAVDAKVVGEKIVRALSQKYTLDGKDLHTSSSVGITLFDRANSENLDSLLNKADAAMYEAKKAGRGTFRFFDPAMHASLQARASMELSLQKACSNEKFELFFQPQINDSGRVFGVEALIRWHDEELGWIPPADFIPIAEDIHLINDIERWVIHTACQTLMNWQDDPCLKPIPIAINISGKHFNNRDFADEVKAIIGKYDIKPGLLRIELRESAVVSKVDESIAKMQSLQASGVQIALDDFGTGHSSLSYIRRLPFNQIKIDQSFVHTMLDDNHDLFIIHSLLTMACMLKLEVIAEGVETDAQQDALKALGCSLFQGYIHSKPLPLEACIDFIRLRNS